MVVTTAKCFREVYTWARYATDQGIFLHFSAYFLQIIPEGPLSPTGETKRIVFCDSDQILKIHTDKLQESRQVQQLLAKNLAQATVAIQGFIANYHRGSEAEREDRKPHDHDVQAIINKARTAA